MSLASIKREFELHHEQLVREGIPDSVSLPILMRAEVEIVKLQLEHDRARVATIKACGTAKYGERVGVSTRTVRRILREAVDEIGRKMSYLVSAQCD